MAYATAQFAHPVTPPISSVVLDLELFEARVLATLLRRHIAGKGKARHALGGISIALRSAGIQDDVGIVVSERGLGAVNGVLVVTDCL